MADAAATATPTPTRTKPTKTRAREVLTEEQVQRWRSRGFLVVHAAPDADTYENGDEGGGTTGEVLTTREAEAFRDAATRVRLRDNANFGGVGFPFLEQEQLGHDGKANVNVNALALHPRLIRASKELLGTQDVMLSQAELWTKVGHAPIGHHAPEYQNQDQRMHCDFPNHTLVVPPPFDQPEAVAMIVYLADWRECGGRTAAVEREGDHDPAYSYPDAFAHMPGMGDLPWINDRAAAEAFLKQRAPATHAFREALYAREKLVDYFVGTVLFYRLDVWHRGTPLLPDRSRIVMNLVFKRKSTAPHLTSWHVGFARNAYNSSLAVRPFPPERGRFESLLETLTEEQREAVGFPSRSDAWWTPQTRMAVQMRYPRMRL